MRESLALLAIAIAIAGCGASDNKAFGKCSYVKPAADGGRPVPPQQKSDDLKVTISVSGTASFDKLQGALCTASSGNFSESVQSSGSVDGSGGYVASWTHESANSAAMNPLCGAVTNLKVDSLTSVVVTASIPANSNNCDGYCQAKSDNDCAASADHASCVSMTTASCKTQCMGSSKITGMGSASTQALAAANGKLGGSGTVDATVDLVFTTLQ